MGAAYILRALVQGEQRLRVPDDVLSIDADRGDARVSHADQIPGQQLIQAGRIVDQGDLVGAEQGAVGGQTRRKQEGRRNDVVVGQRAVAGVHLRFGGGDGQRVGTGDVSV